MLTFTLLTVAAAGAATARWWYKRSNRLAEPPALTHRGAPTQPTLGDESNSEVDVDADVLAPDSGGLNQSLRQSLQQLDERYHRFVYRHIDARIHYERQAQWQSLSGEPLEVEIGYETKLDNWRLARNGGIAVTAALAPLYPPLILGTVSLAIYETYVDVQFVYAEFQQSRRIGMTQFLPISMAGLWLTGNFVSGGIAMFIYSLARKVTSLTQDRTRARLINMLGEQPRMVWVLVDGTECEIPFDQLQTGATLIVRAGQMLPIDGTILTGHATIDQQRLTGEEQPVEKGPGDLALAGTLVLSGSLQVRVEKTGAETLAAQIGIILSQTLSHHLVVEQRAKHIADAWVIPSAIMSSVALVTMGLKRAAAVVINMPAFDMVVIGPLTLMNFLNLASRSHVLIKDGRALELLHQVDTVVFDKTGTLTFGSLQLCAIHRSAALSEADILSYAAAAEQHQSHPLAHAVMDAAAAQGVVVPATDDTQVELGYGLRVWLRDTTSATATDGTELLIRVGSERFMDMEGLCIPSELHTVQAACHSQGYTLAFVARDQQIIGALEFQPTVRPEAAAVIAALKQRNLTTMIISGDQEAPTRKLAEELQVDRYYANVLPTQKAALVKELQSAGRTVCFVGDGINDAIALKQAHVSVSLRGATTVATDTAVIIMMDQRLQSLPALTDLSHELNRNLNVSLGLTTIPALFVVGGVFFFNFGLPVALGTFVTTFILGVMNAMAPALRDQMGSVDVLSATHETSKHLEPPADQSP